MSKFTVKNNLINKTSVVFGLSIYPGLQADLLALPVVTEAMILESLRTGELKSKLLSGELAIIECTMLFASSDDSFTSFLAEVGLSDSTEPNRSDNYLVQPDWYINPTTGLDTNTGDSPGAALKTYAEWQRRAGSFTTLSPSSGLLIINIIEDLSINDPITFRNIIAAGCTARIRGTEKIIDTGTLSSTEDKDPTINQPFTITNDDAEDDDYWTQYVGKKVVITDGYGIGNSAYILRDLGDKTAHVSEWMSNTSLIDGSVIPADTNPEEGDEFKIVDYTEVVLGNMLTGYNAENTPPSDEFIPTGGLLLEYFHTVFGDSRLLPTLPRTTLGHPETVTGLAQSIVDTGLDIMSGNYSNIVGNCLFRGKVIVTTGATFFQFGGAYLPLPNTEYPGALQIDTGGLWLGGGDITFVGDIDSHTSADVQVNGVAEFSAISIWNSGHTIFPLVGGKIWMQASDVFFGNNPAVPLWGTGNQSKIYIYSGANFNITQFKFGESTPTLPTIEFEDEDGYHTVAIMGGSDFGQVPENKGFAFNNSTGAFTGPRDLTWANFDVDIGSGGFKTTDSVEPNDEGIFYRRMSTATAPNINSSIIFSFGAFISS